MMNILIGFLLVLYGKQNTTATPMFHKVNTRATKHSGELNEFMVALSRLLAAQGKNETERAREARQEKGFQPALGQCETTGFETRTREECEEITELECKNVNITLYRTELRPRCKTMFDQTCNVTYTEMPANKCSQVKKKK